MQKLLNWCRQHKILTVVIVIFCLGLVAPKSQSNPSTTSSPSTTSTTSTPVDPAMHAWAVSFDYQFWSACYPDWQFVVNTWHAAEGPYNIRTTRIIDNRCGSLKGNSPDASVNALIDQMTADELNWSIDVDLPTNGFYQDDYQMLASDMKRLNSIITTAING